MVGQFEEQVMPHIAITLLLFGLIHGLIMIYRHRRKPKLFEVTHKGIVHLISSRLRTVAAYRYWSSTGNFRALKHFWIIPDMEQVIVIFGSSVPVWNAAKDWAEQFTGVFAKSDPQRHVNKEQFALMGNNPVYYSDLRFVEETSNGPSTEVTK